MERDKRLIELFVPGLNMSSGGSYKIVEWPDLVTRDQEAVDARARDDQGRWLAIEHTLLQPFGGEKADAVTFKIVAGRLDQRSDLAVRGSAIDLVFQVGAVPRGVDWSTVADRLERWFLAARGNLPEGRSEHSATDLPCELTVTAYKTSLPDSPGTLFVFRSIPDEPIHTSVREALKAKLPKLIAASADERVLLLEMDSPARGYWEVGQAIDDLRCDFGELKSTSSVWLGRTVAWDTERWVLFRLIWPLDLAEQRHNWFTVGPDARLHSPAEKEE